LVPSDNDTSFAVSLNLFFFAQADIVLLSPSPSPWPSRSPYFAPSTQVSESTAFETHRVDPSGNRPVTAHVIETNKLDLSSSRSATELVIETDELNLSVKLSTTLPLIPTAGLTRSDTFLPRKETPSATPESSKSRVAVTVGAVVGGIVIRAVVLTLRHRQEKSGASSVVEALNEASGT
jgi:hypothetical protein